MLVSVFKGHIGYFGWFLVKNSSDFGKVQFCPELSNFSRFYPILGTGEDFSTIVRLFYKPYTNITMAKVIDP